MIYIVMRGLDPGYSAGRVPGTRTALLMEGTLVAHIWATWSGSVFAYAKQNTNNVGGCLYLAGEDL